MKIKICGMKDPEMALFAAKRGADFIGIVHSPHSSRYVSLPLAREIAAAAREGGALPVALFVDASQEEIVQTGEQTGIFLIQAYGEEVVLPDNFHRIYVNRSAQPLRRDKDFLLLDESHGRGILKEEFTPPSQDLSWFLAGGLTPENVGEMVKKYSPFGVDVSSGVEREGKKDKTLIEKFIREARRL